MSDATTPESDAPAPPVSFPRRNAVPTGQSVAHTSPYEYLLALRRRGIEVRLSDAKLRASAAPGVLDAQTERELRARKSELLAFLQPGRAHDVRGEQQKQKQQQQQNSRGESSGPTPLAPAQQRLWLLDRLEPCATAYSLPYAFRIPGRVDVAALRASVRALVARHEALRTHVAVHGSDASLVLDAPPPQPLSVVDLSSRPDTLAAVLRGEAERPFDLQRGPLFRATLYALSDHHVFFFNVHHIVCDGWSIELLLEELFTTYAAEVGGQRAELPPLPMSFAAYARFEHERAASARFERTLLSAVERLKGTEPLDLPLDKPRPSVFSQRGRTLHFALPSELVRAVEALAKGCDTTPYVVLLAAYKLLLSRYTGQRDLVVGSPVAGRDLRETEPLVGFFARTIVVRSELDVGGSFRALVGCVKQSCLAAFAEQQVPFERLVEALSGSRERSRTPLYQTLFAFQETRPRIDPVTGLAWEALPVDHGGAKTDLTMLLEHDGAVVHGKLEYASDLFEKQTIERMVENFRTLLESVVATPEAPAGSARMVSASELAELAELNATEREVAHVGGFYELFRAQARRRPEQVAVVDCAGSLSYEALDRNSDAWAARLQRRGVTRGARVGIALSRTRRVLEVALGALKAGAAYVPLDTSFPRERLAFMASDAGVSIVVAEKETEAGLPTGDFTTLLAEELEQEQSDAPPEPVQNAESDVAYIIYTSGSTGNPKGVEVQHGGVVNLLTSMAQTPGCTEDDRVLAVSTFSFDMCIAELYLPLAVGARTILAPRTCAADGATLARFIDEYGATLVQATPTTFKLLVEAGLPKQRFKAIGGGEAFPGRLARALSRGCTEVWNGYGPTETTVYATFHRIDDPEQPVLIGKPIANARLYVLDAQKQQVPFGVAGELYIAGRGVSGGYANQPVLTEERFLPDPFDTASGARMYRTGDLVRMRRDGAQYVGRADQQVKLRGYRIELAEIENALAQHEQVEQCAVVVRELGEDDQRLVAYVVPKVAGTLDPQALRTQLEQRLPRYMVPRLFVPLTELPLTPSGKVDAKQLPDPRGLAVDDAPAALPSDATERTLLAAWQRVLGVSNISVDDDFFALGGHSLLAVQLMHEINRALHTSISLSLVFDSPTIGAQAKRINLGDHGGGVSVVPLAEGGSKTPLFCICGINLYQKLADELADERPVYGMFLPIESELLAGEDVELDAREMARQYLSAVRTVQPHGPYYLAGVSFGGVLAYEVAQQLIAQGEEVALLGLLEVILPHALGGSRLTRTARRVKALARHLPRSLTELRESARTLLDRGGARGESPPPPSDAALTELLNHRMQRYHGALASYVATMPPYQGKVVLFRGRDQVRAMPDCAADYGWQRYARGGFQRFDVPGDHLGILAEPNVRELSRLLRGCMA